MSNLPDKIREKLGLDASATPESALQQAEQRVKTAKDKLASLPPANPQVPKFKKDVREIEPLLPDLREIVYGGRVDSYCDKIERLLSEKPDNWKADVRDLLRTGKNELANLPPGSMYHGLLNNLEKKYADARLGMPAVEAVHVPATPATPAAPLPPVLPPSPPPDPEIELRKIESLINDGLVCAQKAPPDINGAEKYYASAQTEAAGKSIPAKLSQRLQSLKAALENARKEVARGQIEQTLTEGESCLEKKPADISGAKAKLSAAMVRLQETPSRSLQDRAGALSQKIKDLESPKPLPVLAAIPAVKPPVEEKVTAPPPKLKPKEPEKPKALPPVLPPEEEEEPVLPPALHITSPPPAKPTPAPPVPEPEEKLSAVTEPVQEELLPPIPPPPSRRKRWVLILLLLIAFGALATVALSYLTRPKVSPPIPPSTNQQTVTPLPPITIGTQPTKTVVTPPPPSVAQLSIGVQPPGAELFTNGISLGVSSYPVTLTGSPGESIDLRAQLQNYSNAEMTVSFPGANQTASQTMELSPMPGLLFIRCNPSISSLYLSTDNQPYQAVDNSPDGIAVRPGLPLIAAVNIQDYQPSTLNVPAFQPGEHRTVDFGTLELKNAALRLALEPSDAQVSLIYADRAAVAYNSPSLISDIPARTKFDVKIERENYAPQTLPSMILDPGQTNDLGTITLQPLPASLNVDAYPASFGMQVSWDGVAHPEVVSGSSASGLPVDKLLNVVISADTYNPYSFSVTLSPGEQRKVGPINLARGTGSISVYSQPAAEVYLEGRDTRQQTACALNGLTLNKDYPVKVVLDGYKSEVRTVRLTPNNADRRLDFGQLQPMGTLALNVYPVGSQIQVGTTLLNANDRGEAQVGNLDGTYEIAVRMDGYLPYVREVTVRAGDSKTLSVNLTAVAVLPQLIEKYNELQQMYDAHQQLSQSDARQRLRDFNAFVKANREVINLTSEAQDYVSKIRNLINSMQASSVPNNVPYVP